MSVVIPLSDAEVAEAHHLAELTFAEFRAHHRYPNNLGPSHRKRKLGEIAVEKWARTLGVPVDAPFRDLRLAAREDLVVGGVRLEVMTWHVERWAALGRSVTPGHIPVVRRKADAIVWCALDGDRVTLHGWSTPDDVERAPLAVAGPPHHPFETHQVPAADLRPMETLLDDAAG
ncbi:MAG: hypothetical protein MUE82_10820 [Chloroflexi bacterium]|nr:hypothetical protein [Chloroflexota bacterium]